MTKAETLKLLKYMNSYYGKRFEIPDTTKNLEMLINTWYDFLSEYSLQETIITAKKLMVNQKWPPTPGEIINEIERLKTPEIEQLPAGAAWKMVLKSIEEYSYFYNPEKVKSSLPDKALKAAEAVGLSLIAREGAGNSYLYNHFEKIYNNLCDRENSNKLPPSLRRETDRLVEKYTNPRLEEAHDKKRDSS